MVGLIYHRGVGISNGKWAGYFWDENSQGSPGWFHMSSASVFLFLLFFKKTFFQKSQKSIKYISMENMILKNEKRKTTLKNSY